MAQVNAGRVRFIGRGEYDNSTQYYTFDLVNYNGNSYFAKSNTMGNLPTNSTYWQLVAEKGNVGPTGPTGNGIDHISLTSQSGATKVYTIYFTDGNTTTFTVQDGEVTQEVFDEEIERANMIYNAMPKVSDEGTDLTLNNTAECPVYDVELSPSELEQETTTGKNVLPIIDGEQTYNGITCKIVDGKITISGTSTTNYIWIKLTNGIEFIQGTPSPSNKPAWFSNQSITGETYSFSKIGTTKAFFYTTTSERKILFNENQQTNTIDLSSEILSDVIYYVGGNGTTINETFYLQAVKGSTPDTDFEPYTYGASPNPQYPQEIHTVSGENTIKIKNSDNTQEQTYPLSLGDLEYCKIGDYEDEFYKATESDTGLTAGKWYLKKNIGKTTDTIGSTSKTISDMVSNATVYSYCGGTVSGTTITYTSALVVANYIYYPTTTPTYTLLSDTLQTQLDNIQKAITYQDQTNVSQTNADLPFVISASAIRDLSGIFEEI